MTMKLILWGSIIWILPFLYVTQRNESKFKKNLTIGVTLPYEAREDADVLELLNKYVKETGWICILLGIAVIPCFIPDDYVWILFAWMLWLDFVIVLTQIPFVKYNKKLKALKKEKGWARRSSGKGSDENEDVSEETITVNISNISVPKWISPWVFIIALAITLVPLIFDPEIWPLVLTMVGTQVIFYLVYRYAFRTRSEAVDTNMELTQALTQVRRQYWGRMWVKFAFATSFFSLGMLLLRKHGQAFMWLTIIYSFVVILFAIRPELKIRQVQEILTKDSGKDIYVDDDEHWIWGLFYYNPNDSHTMINVRTGMGSTVNFARPFGKVLAIISIATLLLMPAFPFMIDWGIKSNVDFEVQDQYVVVMSGRDQYKVETEHITSVEYLNEYPEDLTRTWGTATNRILKGNFSSKEYGNMQVCLKPGLTPYILVRTDKRKTYLFGTDDPVKTKELYDLLSAPITGP